MREIIANTCTINAIGTMLQHLDRPGADSVAFVALGANLPAETRLKCLCMKSCLRDLADERIAIRAVSRFYRTPCLPPGAGPDFVNAVAKVATVLDARALLERLHDIEERHGRVRTGRWSPRTIDLDLLALGSEIAPDERTFAHWRDMAPHRRRSEAPNRPILPHPRLQDRAFVLVPWAEIAPDWHHPVSGESVRDMLAALDSRETGGIIPLSPENQAESGLSVLRDRRNGRPCKT